jgi:2-keto-4-pentenoate hydratase/2-oxohepta-3-ene-1,7-dioic acid hydratase in catechol pathway
LHKLAPCFMRRKAARLRHRNRLSMSVSQKLGRALIDGTARHGRFEGNEFCFEGGRVALASVKLLAPCMPSKIVGVGRNYAEHAAEMKNPLPREPLLFFKPASALNDPDGDIVYPSQSSRVDFEGELAVVIRSRCRNVAASAARDVILGYTICNDVTARDLQQSDGQWARAKGFDTFAPLGPWILTNLDPANLHLRTYLNGKLMQDASTSALVFGVNQLVEYVSAVFTLEPGDVIATGTPAGVGPMYPGDVVEVVIDPIGTLRNRVVGSIKKRE